MLFFYQNKDREMFLADLFILPVEAISIIFSGKNIYPSHPELSGQSSQNTLLPDLLFYSRLYS
jgi:hypothetical protein